MIRSEKVILAGVRKINIPDGIESTGFFIGQGLNEKEILNNLFIHPTLGKESLKRFLMLKAILYKL